MAALAAATKISRSGVTVHDGAAATVTDGDTFVNTGVEMVVITNGSGGAVTVTLDVTKTVDGIAVPDKTVNVATGATTIIGPFPVDVYSSTVKVTCSPVTNVKVKVIKP